MKQKLLFLFFSLLMSISGFSQLDDFEDGTVQGWKHKFSNAYEPTNISTDGPAGAGDNYLQMSNSGVEDFNGGSRHIMYNTDSRWLIDYTSAGIVAIRMDVRNAGVNDLHLRVAFWGGNNTWIGSTNAVVVPTGGGWQTIEIPITVSDFTKVSGSDVIANVLADVNSEMRILSNDGSETSLKKGDLRVQISNFDNIAAYTTYLNTRSSKLKNAFSISPNPGRDKLNLRLSKLSNNTTVEVFDVLGKKIYVDNIQAMTKTVNVSRWNNGVYLVRLISDEGTQTKRFVKQ
ncbi:glycan-binding surface protein [Pontimicrobium aquaticum]|uniref:T9SS type A sorting domain-containing protein n=1 Tax=Pontimicrobium aquaticum TaxID=2565367 RepID=A0A4U0ER02_9FLAO|nr:glycan-binding surface protein [Pontimicrobium aquaticum]TJY34127.1 T9SS type A sorting domain-containing protein [Pontimicrobium aquaticum]